MISKILIKNYILIDNLELDLSGGLNIITGETGAGKSILINAIDLVFGAKAGKEVIKSGADKAVIELTIVNYKQNVDELFEKNCIDNNGSEIVLSKEITNTGSRTRVNGCLVNLEFIKEFRELFLDIHSQYQTYSFLQPKFHINLLDSYIKNSGNEKEYFDIYKQEFEQYKLLLKNLEAMRQSSQKTVEQIEFLKFQAEEIEKAEIVSVTEDEELNNELSVLENVEKLKELTGSSYWAINGEENSILEGLSKIKQNINKAVEMDNTLENVSSEILNAIETLKDVSSVLNDYSSSLDNDTERLNQIQERLFLLDKLKRKYGGSLEKVVENGIQFRNELNSVEFSTQNIENLEKEISQKYENLLCLAKEISQKRKVFANKLSDLIVEKLQKLELPKARFEIKVEECELGIHGIDKVEFLISTNISEGLKPLAKVASGGEISRVVLAIKTIFAQTDNIGTIIFDEIDTGISGKTSQAVAEEVKELSKYMQIIMITHQAIIASKSDRHFYVKKVQGDVTKVGIYVLEGENKLKGLAELAGGAITEESLKFAQTLISGGANVR